MHTIEVPCNPPCSPRSPPKLPTTPIQPKLRTARRGEERISGLEWRRSLRDEPFNFLTLPAEIRNRVYEYIYVGRIIHISCTKANGPLHKYCQKPKRAHNHQPALARTCRQVREELLPMFYSQNLFQLWCRRRLAFQGRWINAVEPYHSLLRRVRVYREWPGELDCNMDITLRDDTDVLEEILTVRASAYLYPRHANSMAKQVGRTIRECIDDSNSVLISDEKIRGYIFFEVLKVVAKKDRPAARQHPLPITGPVSPVVGPHAHCLIYPELYQTLTATTGERQPRQV